MNLRLYSFEHIQLLLGKVVNIVRIQGATRVELAHQLRAAAAFTHPARAAVTPLIYLQHVQTHKRDKRKHILYLSY